MISKQFDLIVFDADGTLRYTAGGLDRPPNELNEQCLIDRAVDALKTIDWNTLQFGVASNQGGVGLGYLSQPKAGQLLRAMADAIQSDVDIGEPLIEFCPHAPSAQCPCRKPEPGLLERLTHRAGTTNERMLFVGDRDTDREAAFRAGCAFLPARSFHRQTIKGCIEYAPASPGQRPLFDVSDDERETKT